MMLWCDLKPGTRYVGCGASWERLRCRPRSALVCVLVLPHGLYKVVYSQLPLVLGLKVLGRGYAVDQGQLPLELGLAPFGGYHDNS